MKNRWKIELKKMKSSTYILPLFDMQINFRFLNLMVGSYMFNNHKDLQFSVLYKFSGKEKFLEFEKEMMEHTLYIGHEDYGEYVLYKFRATEVIQKAIDKYILGKYSELTDNQKEAIVGFASRRGAKNAGRIKKILNKDESIRLELEEKINVKIEPGSELSSPPDLSLEVFSDYVTEIEIKGPIYEDS